MGRLSTHIKIVICLQLLFVETVIQHLDRKSRATFPSVALGWIFTAEDLLNLYLTGSIMVNFVSHGVKMVTVILVSMSA